MRFRVFVIFFICFTTFLHSQDKLRTYNPKKLNIQNDTIFVLDSYRDYSIKMFTQNGEYFGEVKTDHGRLNDWIHLSTRKYGRFKFKEFSIWDAIIDPDGLEVFAVKDNNEQFLVIRYNRDSEVIDTLYSSNYELYGLYFDQKKNLYVTQNSSKIVLLTNDLSFKELLTEPSSLYNGITEIIVNEEIGLITANNTDNLIRIYDNEYKLKYSFGGNDFFAREPEDGGGGLVGLDIDKDLYIYSVDWVSRKISLFTPVMTDGKITGYQFDKVVIE